MTNAAPPPRPSLDPHADTRTTPTLPRVGEIVRALVGDKQPDIRGMNDAELAEHVRRDLAGETQTPNTVDHVDGSSTWNDQDIGMGRYATLPIKVSAVMNKALDKVGDEDGIVDLIADLRREDDHYVMVAFIQDAILHRDDGTSAAV